MNMIAIIFMFLILSVIPFAVINIFLFGIFFIIKGIEKWIRGSQFKTTTYFIIILITLVSSMISFYINFGFTGFSDIEWIKTIILGDLLVKGYIMYKAKLSIFDIVTLSLVSILSILVFTGIISSFPSP